LAQAARTQQAIAEVTAAMAAGRTVSEVAHAALDSAARAVAAPFGTLRIIDEVNGRWHFAATHGAAEELNREWQPHAEDMPAPLRIVLRTRRTLRVTRADYTRHYPDIADATAALGVEAIAYVPVFYDGKVSAVVSVGLSSRGADDGVAQAALEALGPIIGEALERARLFEANQSVALALQRALLEHVPLADDRVTVTARYRPASEDALVGGDWYDVVAMRRDRLALIVGDVVGHGVEAAATMGQLRSALTALVGGVDDLAAAVEHFEREARRSPGGISATCLVVMVDPSKEELVYVSAGHPPALLLSPDGDAIYLDDAQGPPLACSPIDRRRPIGRHTFPVGARIVLYTDGLIERRGEPIDVGLDRLRTVASGSRSASVDGLCDDVLAEMLSPDGNYDDVAVVAARLERADSRHFTRHVDDDAGAIASIRQALRAWLERWNIDNARLDAILVSASEALTNSLEHAYRVTGRGAIVLDAHCSDDKLEISVRDHGQWQPAISDPSRGHGLQVMRELADDVVLRPRTDGTSVTLIYRLSNRLQHRSAPIDSS
jgi:serine/threonine-protein kinase RsbW